MRNSSILEPVNAYLEGLVHPSARDDRRMLLSQRNFIAARLFAGLAAVAVLPVHLAIFGAPNLLETIGYAWFALPLILVWHLSRTGDFEQAHLMSAVLFATIVGLIALLTGGGSSFVLPWLIVIPFEPALHASRRTALISAGIAAATVIIIAAFDAFGVLPAPVNLPISLINPHLFSVLSASLYMGMITLGVGPKTAPESATHSRHRLIAENARDLITCHARNGAVSFASSAAQQLLGIQPLALMSHAFFDRVHIADRPIFLTAIAETASKGKPTAIEYRLRQGPLVDERGMPTQPSFVWVETHCHVNGSQVIAVTSDISKTKSFETAAEAAQVEILRVNETKSRFLATVSHELRTPLNAIIGFSEMLTQDEVLDQKRREDYARVITESGKHLLSVVNGILDVSQIEAGNFSISPAAFALAPLVEGCREMMALRAEQAGVALSVKLAPDLPVIVADERAIRQIVINLVSNALKFTGRGGKVELNASIEKNKLMLIVSDSGIGISESDLKQIGNPFFQAANSYRHSHEGTGLGLSVVKGLIDLHGGSLKIQSRLGEGTCVTAMLPLVCKSAGKAESKIEIFPTMGTGQEQKKVKRRA